EKRPQRVLRPLPCGELADANYPIRLTNSGNGHDNSADDGNSGRGSDKGNSRRGNNNFGDVHAYELCGSGHSRLAPCPRTMTSLCLGLDEAISALPTALLLPLERLQSCLSFSS